MTQPTTTAQPFNALPTTPETLYQKLGMYCVGWEQMVLSAMRRLMGDEYQGGCYEFREYLNGGFAMILQDEGPKKVVTLGHSQETMTLEAASFVANLQAFSICNEIAVEKDDADGNQMLHDFYFALKNVVSGRYDFVIDATAPDGTRTPNDAELARILAEAQPHPEGTAILRIID
jgi:hypothetical protein